MYVIRPETPLDLPGIRAVNDAAFGGGSESRLVDRLRAEGAALVSLVAEESGQVIGHILFSHLSIETSEGDIPVAALAPMAVHPEWQRNGIGGELIRAGLRACRDAGLSAVLVLGHVEYYPRFGFSPELARRISSPYSHLGNAWMAVDLVPGTLRGITGKVSYPAAFDEV